MIPLLIFLFSIVRAQATLRLEPGETFKVPRGTHRIWIENKNALQAHSGRDGVVIKAVSPGESDVRLNGKSRSFAVMANGSRKTYDDWQNFSAKLAGVKAGYCADRVCLNGSLYRVRDFLRILNWIGENGSQLYLNLAVPENLQPEVSRILEERLRENGLTPQKIIFSKPWRIYLPPDRRSAALARQMGLLPVQFQKAVDLADNIKVSVRIMELNRSFERKLGVRWPDSFQGQIINNSRFASPDAFDIVINAAEKAGEARLLASPNLICRSGKSAEFFAGGEIPVKISSLRSSSVSWKKYGIGLKLKPLVDSVGAMSLHIETEVSSIDRSVSVDDLPAFHMNRVSSHFDLINRQTIALSGLLKTEDSENSEGLPFLKSLPVLGRLFSSRNFIKNKSELVIFVTPELLSQGEE
jgi:pilus assembly protein CpaC